MPEDGDHLRMAKATLREEPRVTLTIYQAMARVGVSRRTIYHWLKANKIQYVRTAGGSVRIYADSLFRPMVDPGPSSSAR